MCCNRDLFKGNARKYRWSLTYDVLTYEFSTLQWHKSDGPSVETIFQISNFDLFLD